jgi:hypothetical protein
MKNIRNIFSTKYFTLRSETQYTFCDPLMLPVTRIGDAMLILKVLIGDQNTRP